MYVCACKRVRAVYLGGAVAFTVRLAKVRHARVLRRREEGLVRRESFVVLMLAVDTKRVLEDTVASAATPPRCVLAVADVAPHRERPEGARGGGGIFQRLIDTQTP